MDNKIKLKTDDPNYYHEYHLRHYIKKERPPKLDEETRKARHVECQQRYYLKHLDYYKDLRNKYKAKPNLKVIKKARESHIINTERKIVSLKETLAHFEEHLEKMKNVKN